MKGYENTDQDLLNISQSSLHAHSLKLNKKRARLDIAKLFFSNRVINEWNTLSEEIIAGNSLCGFKRKLDRFWEMSGDLCKLNLAIFPVSDQQNYAVLLTCQSQNQSWGRVLSTNRPSFAAANQVVTLIDERVV